MYACRCAIEGQAKDPRYISSPKIPISAMANAFLGHKYSSLRCLAFVFSPAMLLLLIFSGPAVLTLHKDNTASTGHSLPTPAPAPLVPSVPSSSAPPSPPPALPPLPCPPLPSPAFPVISFLLCTIGFLLRSFQYGDWCQDT